MLDQFHHICHFYIVDVIDVVVDDHCAIDALLFCWG